MNKAIISVADQNILFLTEMEHNATMQYFKTGTDPRLLLRYVKSSLADIETLGMAVFDSYDRFRTNQSMIVREDCDGIIIHKLEISLAYLADTNSEKYKAIHGCGMILKCGNRERGILLVGRHGAGKSTLGNALGKNQTLDDDVLMIDDKSMQTIGKHGALTYVKHNGTRYRSYQEKSITEANMDAIFILDKQYTGGYIKQEDSRIPRYDSAIDSLGYNLYSLWKERPPIKVNVPVYRVGTNMNIGGTKCMILSVL